MLLLPSAGSKWVHTDCGSVLAVTLWQFAVCDRLPGSARHAPPVTAADSDLAEHHRLSDRQLGSIE